MCSVPTGLGAKRTQLVHTGFSQDRLTACQPSWHNCAHAHPRTQIGLGGILGSAMLTINKVYLTTGVVCLWALRDAVCQNIPVEPVHRCKHNKHRSMKYTLRPPVYTVTVLCTPTELTEIQSFGLTRSQDLVKIAAYLQQNCAISLKPTRRKKKNLYLLEARCWPCKLYMCTAFIDSLLFFSVWKHIVRRKLVRWILTNCFVNTEGKGSSREVVTSTQISLAV